MAKITASASGTKRKLATPERKNIGMNTMQMQKVETKSRNGNLLRAIQNGLHRFLAHGQVAVDVFDFDGGVIDQDADGQGQAAEGHDVDGFAQAR